MQFIRGISFDLDDTLWDCDSVIQRAEKSLLSWLQAQLPTFSQLNYEQYTQLKQDFNSDNPHLWNDVSVMRRQFLIHILQLHGHEATLVEPAFQHFYRERSNVDLFPDSMQVLNVLVGHYQLAALTNGNADLAQIGIAHLFAEIHYATLECPAKPAPDMFHRACNGMGISPQELLHIGDNPKTDIHGARSSGAKTVWINRFDMDWPEDVEPADYEITDLHQLLELLNL